MASLSPPTGYSSSDLIWEDTFSSSNIDFEKWTGALGQDPFDIFSYHDGLMPPYSGLHLTNGFIQNYFDPFPSGNPVVVGQQQHFATDTTGEHLVSGDGQLDIIAKPQTNQAQYGWSSGAISTYGKTYLPETGGFVQFRVKMPDARYGAWAGLWFMADGDAPGGLEMDLHESGFVGDGSIPPNRILATHWWGEQNQHFYDTGVDLSNDFHIYGIEYNPGENWKIYFDGKLIHTYTTSVPRLRYEIIVDMDIGDVGSAGWHTTPDGRNNGPFVMSVSHVQLYSLPTGNVIPDPGPGPGPNPDPGPLPNPGTLNWPLVGIGDTTGDGYDDLFLRNPTNGEVTLWQMGDQSKPIDYGTIGVIGPEWDFVGTARLGVSNNCRAIWQNSQTGELFEYVLRGTNVVSADSIGTPNANGLPK